MKEIRRILTSIWLLISLSTLVACNKSESDTFQKEEQSSQQSVKNANENGSTDVYPIVKLSEANTPNRTLVIEHLLGKTEVPIAPKNIVVFDFGTLDNLTELGVEIKGLGKENIPKYLNEYQNAKYVNLGGTREPNLEKISQLQPGLIIISFRQAPLYQELSKIAPTIYMGVDNHNYLLSLKKNLTTLGQIFNKEAQSAQMIKEIDEALSLVNQKEFKASTMVLMASQEALLTFGEGSRLGLIYDVFNFQPSDTHLTDRMHGQKVTYEYLVEQNPEVLLLIDRNEAIGGKATLDELVKMPILQQVKAIESKKVFKLDSDAWFLASGGKSAFMTMIKDVEEAKKSIN